MAVQGPLCIKLSGLKCKMNSLILLFYVLNTSSFGMPTWLPLIVLVASCLGHCRRRRASGSDCSEAGSRHHQRITVGSAATLSSDSQSDLRRKKHHHYFSDADRLFWSICPMIDLAFDTHCWLSLMAIVPLVVSMFIAACLMASTHARVLCRMPSAFFNRPYYLSYVEKLYHCMFSPCSRPLRANDLRA